MNKNLKTALKIAIAFILLFSYYYTFKSLKDKGSDYELIAVLNWVDGFFLVVSFSIIQIFANIFQKLKNKVLLRWILIAIIYILLYGIFAFPNMIVSFLQSLKVNSLLHFTILLLILEVLFEIFDARITNHKKGEENLLL